MDAVLNFFEQTGVALGLLLGLLYGLFRGSRAVWTTIKPLIIGWFHPHFTLIESLTTRNEQQYVYDENNSKRFGALMTKREICTIAELHCNVIDSIADGSEHVKDRVQDLRDELHRMVDSDPDMNARSHQD